MNIEALQSSDVAKVKTQQLTVMKPSLIKKADQMARLYYADSTSHPLEWEISLIPLT